MNTEETANQMDIKPLILVAEDTDSNYLLVSTILRKEYELVRAHDGEEAIALFHARQPQLILMDMKMPKKDGVQATKEIRETQTIIPIIALTAFAFDNDRMRALEAGCDEFVTKPIQHKELKEIIKKHLYRQP